MLQLDRLSVHYGSLPAVREISLDVRQGEIVGVVGPNGAGKTTMLAAIMGLLQVSSGTIVYDGESLVGVRPEQIVRRGIALVPEGRQIFTSLTVAENLQLGETPVRARGASAEREALLERFPALARLYGKSAGGLSGGEQQQLAIARALLSRPRMLLLDEPSLGLAPLIVDLVFETLAELRADGLTILLVEQNAARTLAFADRSYILRTGEVVLSGTRGDFAERPDLAADFLGV
jgi:branched-chain amino acid transport system ATP-binding protein